MQFNRDVNCKETQIKLGVKVCEIHVNSGLPNTTRPSVSYYQKYNFESESWWPKFDRLRQKFNIQIVKGDKKQANKVNNKINNQITNNSAQKVEK